MSQAEEEAEKVARAVIRRIMKDEYRVKRILTNEEILKGYDKTPPNDKKDTPAREKLRRLWRLWM